MMGIGTLMVIVFSDPMVSRVLEPCS